MIVTDVNVIAYYYFPGPFKALAHAILAKDPAWFVPPLMLSEFRSILSGYVHHQRIALEDAVDLAARVELTFRSRIRSVPSRFVLEFSRDSGCSTYDCEYAALASVLDVPLVTNDRKVLQAFPKRAVSLEKFIAA